MDVLKDWLFKRQIAYQKRARDWGLQEPKGLLLLGVPGCGKSLTAKSIASFGICHYYVWMLAKYSKD